MKKTNIIKLVIVAFISLSLLGCTASTNKQSGKKISQKGKYKIALNFTPGDITSYNVKTMSEDSVLFEGKVPDKIDSKEKKNFNQTEIAFTQQIVSVKQNGNATALITINGIKFLTIYKNDTLLDFDSSRESDKTSGIYDLIGKSYTIEMSPDGEFINLIDANDLLITFRGSTPSHASARSLIDEPAIKERHGFLLLPTKNNNKLSKGDKWSESQLFSFRMMGGKNFEKVYTISDFNDVNGTTVANIEMNAIPAEMTEQMLKEQPPSDYSKMFDNKTNFSGNLKLDLTNGKINNYCEKLETEWVIVDPSAAAESTPASLKMASKRSYCVEKIK